MRLSFLRIALAVPLVAGAGSCFWDFDESLLGTDGGCLDDLGVQHPGTEPTACGRGGGLCAVCSGTFDTCFEGACTPANPPVAIAAGGQNTCAIDLEGEVFCWGSSRFGQLGLAKSESAEPVRIELPEPARSVAVGGEFPSSVCAIVGVGRLLCWGDNGEGQVGTGAPGGLVLTPTDVGGAGVWQDVAIGSFVAVGVREGSLLGWGAGDGGQNGHPPGTSPRSPTVIAGQPTTYTQVAHDGYHGCGIHDVEDGAGTLSCWGANDAGQLGTGAVSLEPPEAPVLVASPTGYLDVAVGMNHSCGVRTGGRLFCWGDGADGRVGSGSVGVEPAPVEAGAGSGPFTKVVAGNAFSCALDEAGGVWCFGTNTNGQMAAPPEVTASFLVPTRIVPDLEVVDLAAGSGHVCVITRERRIYCWGSNSESQVGDPLDRNSEHPTRQEVVLGS